MHSSVQGMWWSTGFEVITTGLSLFPDLLICKDIPDAHPHNSSMLIGCLYTMHPLTPVEINMFKMVMHSDKSHSQGADFQVREGHKFTTQIQALPHLANIHVISQNSSVRETCLMISQYATILKVSLIREIEALESSLRAQRQMSGNCFLVFMSCCAR